MVLRQMLLRLSGCQRRSEKAEYNGDQVRVHRGERGAKHKLQNKVLFQFLKNEGKENEYISRSRASKLFVHKAT